MKRIHINKEIDINLQICKSVGEISNKEKEKRKATIVEAGVSMYNSNHSKGR